MKVFTGLPHAAFAHTSLAADCIAWLSGVLSGLPIVFFPLPQTVNPNAKSGHHRRASGAPTGNHVSVALGGAGCKTGHFISFPLEGCANGAPRLSLFHCSVSGPHRGGQHVQRGQPKRKNPVDTEGGGELDTKQQTCSKLVRVFTRSSWDRFSACDETTTLYMNDSSSVIARCMFPSARPSAGVARYAVTMLSMVSKSRIVPDCTCLAMVTANEKYSSRGSLSSRTLT